ncbi:hypothetical protein ACHAWF_006086 [Thalassiosira exigua]
MKRRKVIISIPCILACLLDGKSAHSFRLQSPPKVMRKSVTQLNVGYINPRYWSDVEPHAERMTATSKDSKLTPLESSWTKYCMIAYVAHMCAFLPMSLLPTYVQTKLGLLSKPESEHQALQVGQKCAATLLKWIPFMNLEITPNVVDDPEPTIWVSNHVSNLDTFVFLAADEKLRGKNRRPLKTIYWKGLDANPICRILFHMAGFISVDMANNGSGNPNEYNRTSFKQMLKDTEKAIDEGFDIFILPEGQLNPNPEKGLQPMLPGAYALAKSSKRPIQMVALHGCHNLWHADESIGMSPVDRTVKYKAYPPIRREFDSAEDFIEAFTAIAGTFGSTGKDLPSEELDRWFNQPE